MNIKQIKRAHGLKDKDLARAFGYASTIAYQSSSAKLRIDKGIEFIYNLTKQKTDKN
jgi:hypothetical protein